MVDEIKDTYTEERPEESEEVDRDSVSTQSEDIALEGTGNLEGTHVTLRQAGAKSITADNVVIRQGGVVNAQAKHLEMLQGGVVLAQTQTAHLTASQAHVVLSGGDVTLEQAGARMLLAKGDVTMAQSGAVVMAAGKVKAENCGTIFLLARQVEGTVNTALGPRESVIFGIIAGAVAGLVLLLGRLARRR